MTSHQARNAQLRQTVRNLLAELWGVPSDSKITVIYELG